MNVKKFRPHKKYRYLPGSISEEANNDDLKKYNLHRYRVFVEKARVDTSPLKMNPYNMINIRKLKEDLARAVKIDRDNKELLKKINMINRKGGLVDTYNPWAYRRLNLWKYHENEMKEIELTNKYIYKLIGSSKSQYAKEQMERDWQTTLDKIRHSCKFPLVILNKINIDHTLRCQPSISNGLQRGNVERPLCFLEFHVKNGEYLGRLVIELYYDHVPVTVQNFLEICKGEELTYKNCPVHRIIKGQYLETGDITNGTGRGGFSIYGKSFQEEKHRLKHTKAGVLSMKRLSPTENNSQFCITFTKMEQLDYRNVVFGNVINGNATLFKIQDFGRKVGKPHADIYISNCGEIQLK